MLKISIGLLLIGYIYLLGLPAAEYMFTDKRPRIRGFTTMRYINLRFTYLLTYLLTYFLYKIITKTKNEKRRPMPNVTVALTNIGGALCLTPTTRCRAVTLPRRETR